MFRVHGTNLKGELHGRIAYFQDLEELIGWLLDYSNRNPYKVFAVKDGKDENRENWMFVSDGMRGNDPWPNVGPVGRTHNNFR